MFFKKTPEVENLTQAALIAELLRERRRDRRASLIKAGFAGLAITTYLWWMGATIGLLEPKKPTEDYAAVVKISGMIAPDKGASYEALAPLLQQAFENPKSKGVVLLINSPGGTPVQAGLIHDLVLNLKQKYHKPVVAVGEDMVTSGAYMIAVAADKIVVHNSSVVGSIGVISSGFGFNKLMDKLGVERRVTTAGDSKNLMDPFSPINPKFELKQQELLNAIHSQFKDIVIAGRGQNLNLTTSGLFEGNVWTGDKAVTVGLADELGTIQTAATKYIGTDNTLVLSSKKPILQAMADTIGVRITMALTENAMPQLTSAPLP